MARQKTEIKGYHVFYTVFFVAYFFVLYFLLYNPSGFSPFQINAHFFSNVVGSLCRRFIGETAPYALLFYLIYISKRKWLRIVLIAFFLFILTLNIAVALYYFVTRTDMSWYVVKGLQWNLVFGYAHGLLLVILIALLASMAALSIFLYRIKSTSSISKKKQLLFLSLIVGMIYVGNFIPVVYNQNMSIFASDKLQKMQYRIFDLDKSGITILANAFRSEYFQPQPKKEPLTEDEQKYIAGTGLEEKMTVPSGFHPKKVVMIVLENTNQSFLSRYNSEIPGTTPFIDSLIDRYPHLDAFYPSGTYTLYGLSSLLCSHINTARMQKDSGYECLPNLLKKAGYLTEFIRGFSKYYVHENVFFNKIGFDSITALEDFDKEFPHFKTDRPDLYGTWGFSDNYLFDEVIKQLKDKPDEKQFLTILTVDTHATGGRCYRKKTDSDNKNDVLFSVGCTDTVLKDFFAKLETNNLFNDDLLVILTSDHLYSSYSQVPGDKSWDSFSSLPGTLPLIFVSKAPVSILANSGSQVDLAPTLLDLLDIEAPASFMGRSLMGNTTSVPIGQDGLNTYLLIGEQFMRLNMFDKQLSSALPASHFGDYLSLVSGSPDELNLQIGQRRLEQERTLNTDSALLKWLRNNW